MDQDDRCPATNRDGERCGHPEGWGTDSKSGPCKFHGGAAKNQGAPEGNTNAVKHGMHTDEHGWYDDVATDGEREIVDNVHRSYLERYRDRHGEPDYADRMELFLCAVTIGQEIHGQKWARDKADELDSGNALVDKETKYTEDGKPYHKYKQTVILKATTALSNRRRQWLKDKGLLDDPESQKATALSSMKDAWKERAQSESTSE